MRRFGLTLIELLVVVAIIALLIAVMIPCLQSSRRRAKAVLCSSNIKQLLFGLLGYEVENDTFPYGFDDTTGQPPPGGYTGASMYDRVGWWWFNYIEGLYSKAKSQKTVLWCPSRQIKNRELNYVLHGNYGVNLSLCKSSSGRQSRSEFIGEPLRSSDIPHPAQTLLIVNSGYSIITWWHAADTPPVTLGNTIIEDTAYIPGLKINTERALWPGQERDAINGRHPNKTVNVGFADGHISRSKADDLLVEKTDNGYKNLSPLWLPK